jgi:ABC-type spermidine/putrescine transport system permease subunit I
VIKSQFLNIRDWPFGSATSITLTVVWADAAGSLARLTVAE